MDKDILTLKGSLILIVDDDPHNLNVLQSALEAEGYKIAGATSGAKALEIAAQIQPALILLDVRMPTMNGFETCQRLKANTITADIPVIFITVDTDKKSLISGFQAGGVDYITKPFEKEEVSLRVETHLKMHLLTQALIEKNRALEQEISRREEAEKERDLAEDARQKASEQLSVLSQQEAERWGIAGFVAQSRTMAKIIDDIRSLQDYDKISVLIMGENGTGKEMIARAIHYSSPRSNRPFLTLDCTSIPTELAETTLFGHVRGAFSGAEEAHTGYFERASGGTLFLDEIGDMPLGVQPKLLRAIEYGRITPVGATKEKQTDVRILSATNADLEEKVAKGEFRKDLYFRIASYPVTVPPLRERKEDIPALASHFLNEFGSQKPVLSSQALDALASYQFPGNIRELKNIIERAVIKNRRVSPIRPEHLELIGRHTASPDTSAYESRFTILQASTRETISNRLSYGESLNYFKRRLIEMALDECDGNQTKAADWIGMQRTHLNKLIKDLQIDIDKRS